MLFNGKKAIYLQIADMICDQILLGQYEEEGRVPSVRETAAQVEVNSNTVMRSYDWLQSQQIIFTKRGLGYFVSENAPLQIRKLRKEQFFSEFLPQLAEKMKQLNISEEDLKKALAQYK